jgi:hypothetical protein
MFVGSRIVTVDFGRGEKLVARRDFEHSLSAMAPDDPDDLSPALARDAVDAERVRLFGVVRRAIALVRTYRAEEGRVGGPRETACLATVREARASLSKLRSTNAPPLAAGPGLVKGTPALARGERKSS